MLGQSMSSKATAASKENGYHTLCHGHPERQAPAVEVTTGPLGQGVANAVGLAIASKNLAANFNKPGCELIQSTIWCTTGDGCLMEGVALEGMPLTAEDRVKTVQLTMVSDSYLPGWPSAARQSCSHLRQQCRNLRRSTGLDQH